MTSGALCRHVTNKLGPKSGCELVLELSAVVLAMT